ncbi:MAG: hypothetical protein FOGNACKC_03117 [Anaerolineae bacterium]|nr:hypothetical protein [Anaerolineae bacterium]
MSRTRRRLISVAVLILVVEIIAIPVAIIFKWPYQFGGPGDPNTIASDFVFLGTAISAPVFPILVLLVLFIFLSRSQKWWGTLGVVGFCLIGILMFIGALGEAFAPSTSVVPRLVLVVSGVVNGIFSVALLFLAIAELIDRVRVRRKPVRGYE